MTIEKKLGRTAARLIEVAFGITATAASVAVPLDDYYQIEEAREVHTAIGGAGAQITIEKLTGTQAPGAGQNCFKTSVFDLNGVPPNTVKSLKVSGLVPPLTAAQVAGQTFAPGDRIGVTFAGTLTALAGVSVQIRLKPLRIPAVQAR